MRYSDIVDESPNRPQFSELRILTDMEVSRLSMTQPNKDMFDRLKYLSPGNWSREQTHYCIFDGKKLVAVGSTQQNPYQDDVIWLMHVSIDPAYKGKGLARKVVEAIYKDVAEKGLKVSPSSFSQEGYDTIRSTIRRMEQLYPNNVIPAKDEVSF